MRILCVDDEPKNLKLLEAILLPAGYEAVTAESGERALALIAERAPDLILLDIMMPGLSGYDVLAKVRAGEKTRLIPVVMVTALREVEDRVKALDLGCDDFISKPFDKVEMLARVKSLLRISYYRSQLDEKEKFELLLNQIADALVVLRGDLALLRSNKPAQDLLQLPAEYAGDLAAHLQSKFQPRYQGDLAADLKTKPLTFDLLRPETPQARALVLEIRSSVIRDPAGKVVNIILLGRNVTEEREEARLKQNFFDLISHKLMTPMTLAVSHSEMFMQGLYGPLNEAQKKAADTVYRQIQLLKAMVVRMLTYITINPENIAASPEELNVKEQLTRLGGQMAKAGAKQVELSITGPDDLKLKMNRNYFELMAGHLIENAIKFGDKEPVRIKVELSSANGRLKLSVSDNGPGIPPEEQGNIFKELYQGEKNFTGQIEGAGLGLALVKKLVELSGGQVGVSSALGQGTTITVELPAG